jgi:hypothetical protein
MSGTIYMINEIYHAFAHEEDGMDVSNVHIESGAYASFDDAVDVCNRLNSIFRESALQRHYQREAMRKHQHEIAQKRYEHAIDAYTLFQVNGMASDKNVPQPPEPYVESEFSLDRYKQEDLIKGSYIEYEVISVTLR